MVWERVKQPSKYLLQTDISPLAAGLLGDLGDGVGVYHAESGESNAERRSGCLRRIYWAGHSPVFSPPVLLTLSHISRARCPGACYY